MLQWASLLVYVRQSLWKVRSKSTACIPSDGGIVAFQEFMALKTGSRFR